MTYQAADSRILHDAAYVRSDILQVRVVVFLNIVCGILVIRFFIVLLGGG